MRTKWTPLQRELSPRFGHNFEVQLPSLKPEALSEKSDFKM